MNNMGKDEIKLTRIYNAVFLITILILEYLLWNIFKKFISLSMNSFSTWSFFEFIISLLHEFLLSIISPSLLFDIIQSIIWLSDDECRYMP